jgi:hypothetical protein
LKQPFDAYFLITSLARFPLPYALQDDKEHFVKELVVPPNTEVPIQIVLEPKVSFMQHELSFGCDESLADENKPSATEYFVPFVMKGLRGSANRTRIIQDITSITMGFITSERIIFTRKILA